MIRRLFTRENKRHDRMTRMHLVLDSMRCVQCGICSFNCPIGIDVRRHAWESKPVSDSHCLSCGECIRRCPRGVIRFDVGDPERSQAV